MLLEHVSDAVLSPIVFVYKVSSMSLYRLESVKVTSQVGFTDCATVFEDSPDKRLDSCLFHSLIAPIKVTSQKTEYFVGLFSCFGDIYSPYKSWTPR